MNKQLVVVERVTQELMAKIRAKGGCPTETVIRRELYGDGIIVSVKGILIEELRLPSSELERD